MSGNEELTPAQRLKAGLPLKEEEPVKTLTRPGIECAKGRPFEFGIPSGVDYILDVAHDFEGLKKYLLLGVRVDLVDRENPESKPVNGIVFGYTEDALDNVWNRTMLGIAYNIAVDWARKAYTTGKSTPLSDAFKAFMAASLSSANVSDVNDAMGNSLSSEK
ncbi:hypothetical protein KHU50_003392 [Colletotrichum sp. SAR 10_65]|nr:hypothetical protein KHU50_003392 [Colletotrichum sp. SAR 10_65]KAI8180726.1 hypothetical protein K4K51_002413 [Colletotrichum sp. SAR 10_75]